VSENKPNAGMAGVTDTVVTLRRSFDEGFAAPAALVNAQVEDLLAIRLASEPYALRLSEIAGLHVDIKIVPVPSPAGQLLGIIGIRGVMTPIYDLAALLRYPPGENPRWIVFARGSQRVGLAFETFESHLQVPQGSLGTVRAAGSLRPIIQLASVVATIRNINS
jgi:chemotaxis signal transduction protein